MRLNSKVLLNARSVAVQNKSNVSKHGGVFSVTTAK